jgi:hypothetical protein
VRGSDDHLPSGAKAAPPLVRLPSADAGTKKGSARGPAGTSGGAALPADIAFLSKHGIPERILRCAALLAACRRTHASHELIAAGFDRQRYWQLLAAELRVRFVDDLSEATFYADPETLTTEAVRAGASVRVLLGRVVTLVVAPGPNEIPRLVLRLAENSRLAQRVVIAAPETIRGFLAARRHAFLTDYAVNRLSRSLPPLSARQVALRPEPRGPVTLIAALLGFFLLAPAAGFAALGAFFTLFFFNCAVWRSAAALSRPRPLRLEPLPSAMLPRYTVLVPLYREAEVVGDLLRRIAALDYPALCSNSTKPAGPI